MPRTLFMERKVARPSALPFRTYNVSRRCSMKNGLTINWDAGTLSNLRQLGSRLLQGFDDHEFSVITQAALSGRFGADRILANQVSAPIVCSC
jgi:hypothetical protein